MLPKNVPEDLPVEAQDVLIERLPNFCPSCGEETIIAGGRLEPTEGWYEHLDPVLDCATPDCGWQSRFTAGINQEEGQKFRVAPGAKEWDGKFAGFVGFCGIHMEPMNPTKDLLLEGRPMRQYKCPECDNEAVFALEKGSDGFSYEW